MLPVVFSNTETPDKRTASQSSELFGMNQGVVTSSIATQAIELVVEAPDALARQHEPITCGIPFPRGLIHDPQHLVMQNANGAPLPLQTRVLDRWPDQSLRWILLDWQADACRTARVQLCHQPQRLLSNADVSGIRIRAELGGLHVDTGPAQFHLRRAGAFPFESVRDADGELLDATQSGFAVEDETGRRFTPRITELQMEEAGSLRAAVRFEGTLEVDGHGEPLADLFARLHFFANSSTVRFSITLRNPRRALHPGGLWELGDSGSIYLRDVALVFALRGSEPAVVSCSPEPDAPLKHYDPPFELYQDSSGGANWRSSNHVNRRRLVPNTFRGYRLRSAAGETTGLRATPVVSLECGPRQLAVAMEHFWQNFPKALEATHASLTLRLWPRQYADVHELQGGEQKTHTFYVAFAPDSVTLEPLAWCRRPLLARATPEWYCNSGALAYLTPRATDDDDVYLGLVDAAITGDDTFEHKREVIDEYGWRHFGDVYGDHEAVRHSRPAPLVSHYNNQYDALGGFGTQFLRSGDARWWRHMAELAAHVIDIDIYHTRQDKAAYNNGVFWHTCHYIDAGTSTHRTYPRAAGVSGGGPAAAQTYTSGLLLHHFLTGDPLSRQTAIELAQWIIDLDDGGLTVFRWLARGCTGHASASGTPHYHGPGRAPANAAATLLNAHRLTGEARFRDKAEQLIRRCIHPSEDIRRHDLGHVEMKWYYTMFLQTLGRYLDDKVERGELDRMYAYGRASLLHYARWMVENEYPYLDKPERLEFPTETWAAQDMRKSDIFKFAAKHAAGKERDRFLERSEYFFSTSVTTLARMKTRTLARPVVVMLGQGYMHTYFQQHPDETAPAPRDAQHDFGAPEVFVPQKERAKKRFVALAGAGAALLLVGLAGWLLLGK